MNLVACMMRMNPFQFVLFLTSFTMFVIPVISWLIQMQPNWSKKNSMHAASKLRCSKIQFFCMEQSLDHPSILGHLNLMSSCVQKYTWAKVRLSLESERVALYSLCEGRPSKDFQRCLIRLKFPSFSNSSLAVSPFTRSNLII